MKRRTSRAAATGARWSDCDRAVGWSSLVATSQA
jgi:hypothetical protein